MQPMKQSGRLTLAATAAAIGLSISGCAGVKPASLNGECRIFTAPDHVVRGVTRSDKYWIDTNIEAGIAACDWPRPKPQVAKKKRHYIKKKPAAAITQTAPIASTPPVPATLAPPAPAVVYKPPDKPSLIKRLRSKLHRKPKP